jgi:lipopolysaccharide transport system permease protein
MSLSTGLGQLWRFRGFVTGSVNREFQSRYRNSLLGAAWTILNPLSMIAVYTLVFSQVMRAKLPGVDSTFAYSIFLMAGLIPWGLFAEIVSRGQNLFLENANLIKKVSFPKACLPAILLLSSLTNFAIILGLFLGVAVLLGVTPGWAILGIIPLVLLELIIAMSLALILGVFNVFFRDAGQLTGIFLQFCFWLTPIVYAIDIIPEGYRGWLSLNPLAPLFAGFQTIFVQNTFPDWRTLQPTVVVALLLVFYAALVVNRHADDMVDEL